MLCRVNLTCLEPPFWKHLPLQTPVFRSPSSLRCLSSLSQKTPGEKAFQLLLLKTNRESLDSFCTLGES